MSQVIIVPYRDRVNHLRQFILHVNEKMPGMPIIIVEQTPGKPFNRGKLLNIGVLERSWMFNYLIFHDVDMLPLFEQYEPSRTAPVIQFAASKIQLRDYLGGVTMFREDVFEAVGGYHNDYFHRAEDNEMRFNLKRLRVPVLEDHKEFEVLNHDRDPGNEFIASLWHKAQEKRSQQNQLANCVYEIKKRQKINPLTTHILVDI